MFLRELQQPVSSLHGISDRKTEKLARAGIVTVSALLTRYPKDYEDRGETVPLRDYHKQRSVCTTVRVVDHAPFTFRGERKWKIIVEDDTARAVVPCFFKTDYMVKRLFVGGEFRIAGRFEKNKYGELQSTHIEFEEANAPLSKFGEIIPIYYYADSERNALLRAAMRTALQQYAAHIEDELPASLIRRDGLLPKARALHALHFPAAQSELALARRTLIYEELFYLEILVGKRALTRRVGSGEWGVGSRDAGSGTDCGQGKLSDDSTPSPQAKAGVLGGLPPREGGSGERAAVEARGETSPPFPIPHSPLPTPRSPLQQRLLDRLPFQLTAGQLAAIAEINRDMDAAYPMARLLQGDVGSGKTLVAFFAALRAVEHGAQAALMAPTELLARQHAENAARLLEPLGLRVAFLTGNIKTAGRNQLLRALAAGEIDLAVGTHALFSKDVAYRNLSLVVIDEQHRFGVTQRQMIVSKGDRCDLLMMSATPIPRTLAMTLFGDMDVSVIEDMPPGRKPVITHLACEINEAKVYNFVRGELAAGRQAYFVYPLIEANEELDLKDAESMYRRLSGEVFPQYPCALIHSRLDEDAKRVIMDDFRAGRTQVLTATSVVEVGVDVPNAACMVIEHAERFGLSALHQLRGRVGRGEHQSYCFLIYSKQDVPAKYANMRAELLDDGERTKEGRRLMVMLNKSDGFAIAEEDLKFRGPGQIIGTEQSGFMRLGIADPVRDLDMLERARRDAFALLEADPSLAAPENAVITEVLRRAAPFA